MAGPPCSGEIAAVDRGVDSRRGVITRNGQPWAQVNERYLTDEPVLAGPPTAGYRLRKFVKRNRGPVLAAAIVLTTLLAGIVGTSWGWFEALYQRDVAVQARKDEAEQGKAVKAHAEKLTLAHAKADRLAQDEKAARKLMEANLALERARAHFDRDQVAPGLHWLVRGLEAVPKKEADLEHAFRVLLSGWGREIHPLKQVVVLSDFDFEINQLFLARSPDGQIQVRRGKS